MITAIFNYNKNRVISYEMTEHADSDELGKDLVCAGVSAVVFGLTNAIISLDESEPAITMEDGGYLLVENIPDSEAAQTLIDGMIISLRTIEQSEDNLKFLTVIEDK